MNSHKIYRITVGGNTIVGTCQECADKLGIKYKVLSNKITAQRKKKTNKVSKYQIEDLGWQYNYKLYKKGKHIKTFDTIKEVAKYTLYSREQVSKMLAQGKEFGFYDYTVVREEKKYDI